MLLLHRSGNKDLVTGWTDVDFSEMGVKEAKETGVTLKHEGFIVDLVFTSLLKRAIRTVLDEMDLMWIPTQLDWRLNEEHYGAMQEPNKAQTAAQYGRHKKFWRRRTTLIPSAGTDRPAFIRERIPRYKNLIKQQLPLRNASKTRWNDSCPVVMN